MGNTTSVPSPPSVVVQEEEKLSPTPQSSIQIPQRKSNRSLVTDSLVAGSPLDRFSTSNPERTAWIPKDPVINETASVAPEFSSPLQNELGQLSLDNFMHPQGEPSYKNNSKIVHSYGPTGFAPFSSLDQKKENMIPIMITWTQGGKTVYLTGSFNNWKQKIRLHKRYLSLNQY